MTFLKDETTATLDSANLTTAEAVELYRDFVDNIDDPMLRPLLAEHADVQSERLQRLENLRRERGQLPQAGDPERSHVGFAGAYLRGHVLPGDATAHYAESLLATANGVAECLTQALGLELDAELESVLIDLERHNAALMTALQAVLEQRGAP